MVRVDGPVKVCGEAEFAGDVQPPGAAWAALVTSPVARGLLRRLDAAAARRAAGVLAVLTHENCADAVREVKHMMAGGWANSTLRPLASPEIHYAGQIVAVVVAERGQKRRRRRRRRHRQRRSDASEGTNRRIFGD